MNSKQKQIILLIFLVFLLFAINYNFLNEKLEDYFLNYEIIRINRVIDGDTVVSGNESIRFLGINTPEKGEKYYSEAKEFLEELILNESVRIVYGKEKIDRYGRTLGYLFIDDENVNLKLVEKGFANYYFPSGKDIYYSEFEEAWNKCLNKNINLCEFSKDKCAKCIELEKFDYKNQKILFANKCEFECDLTDWNIKDEGRKKFIFENFILKSGKKIEVKVGEKENTGDILYWKGENYVWTSTGDTLFLRDNENKLVLWKSY